MKKQELYEMILALQQRVAALELVNSPLQPMKRQFRTAPLPAQEISHDAWKDAHDAYCEKVTTPEKAKQVASQVRQATDFSLRALPPIEDEPA